jgi:hypothetical protein
VYNYNLYNRAMAVVIGEKDNKEVLEKRKRSERKERLQMNRYKKIKIKLIS